MTGIEFHCFESGSAKDSVSNSGFPDTWGTEEKDGRLFSGNQPFIELSFNGWMKTYSILHLNVRYDSL